MSRTLSLILLGSAAALLAGCADGPGNGTTSSGTTSGASGGVTSGASGGVTGGTTGNTTGSCSSSTNCPVVTVLLDGKTVDNLADISGHALVTWTSTNTDTTTGTTPCTPSGGLGTPTDPWQGPLPYQSTPPGLTEQPVANGVYTFVLTCINTTGDGASAGAATLTVGPITGNEKSITVTVTAAPTSIALGDSSTLTWSALDTDASSDSSITCTHTSSPVDPVWNAAATTASGMVTVTPATAVVYTYVLTCTNASGGNGAGAAAVAVGDNNNPPLIQCPAGQTFQSFRNTSISDKTYTASADTGGLCLLCSVTPNPPTNLVAPVTANDLGTPAVISLPIGLIIDGGNVTVTDTLGPITPAPGGNVVGFVISEPGNPILSLEALQNIAISTLAADGTVVERAGNLTAVNLDLLSLFTDPTKRAVVINAKLPYSSVKLSVSGIAHLITNVNVYEAGACVAPGSTGGTSGGSSGG